ncbi:MAG TPA: glycosyltransferase family 4 protein, partial [Solirubrobacteraceae bacterium]|nr:glycosyltransferase family 4 protein [Solirubrobacteraceae bacterium]
MTRVLICSGEPVGAAMAGPAVRAAELGRVLRDAGHEITTLHVGDRRAATAAAARHDVVVVQGWVLERAPGVGEAARHLVVDLYDPFSLELLMLLEDRPAAERERAQANALRALGDQLERGDFFLCASERQRDYWLGWLEAHGRVSPRTHAADPSLRAVIDVVPFGTPSDAPRRSGAPGPRERFGIAADAPLLLWGGGVYDWLDPSTVVEAVNRVEGAHLVFMSAGHPNPGQPASRELARAREAAGPRVHFNDGWVAYEARADWLLDADAGVSAHRDHVEARFAFRTRVLDYLWAGLPVLCTEGDALAEAVAERGAGTVLAPGDVGGWTQAIRERPERREAAARAAGELGAELRW